MTRKHWILVAGVMAWLYLGLGWVILLTVNNPSSAMIAFIASLALFFVGGALRATSRE
jgi:uncharacterized protein (DUF58 family)